MDNKRPECLNRPVIERIARELFKIEDEDRIDAFVNEFVYTMLFY